MNKLITVSRYFINAVLAAVLLASCGLDTHRDDTQKNDSGIGLVGRYEVMENGMKYIVYREVDGGLFIINTTRDSLEVAVARQRLSANSR